jgi:hypothetical protein
MKKAGFESHGLALASQAYPGMVNLYGLMDDNRMVNHARIFQK